MRFVVAEGAGFRRPTSFPHVILRRDNWDDYGYKTLFNATLTLSAGRSVDLGNVKILQRGQESGRTPLENQFSTLDDSYCSLGQSLAYYETLATALSEADKNDYLTAMRDAAANEEIERSFRREDGWETSLLRFGEANNALEAGGLLLRGQRKKAGVLSFTYEAGLGDSLLRIPFVFDDAAQLPGRCNVLIGYNGAGKTHLLADLARVASGYGRKRSKQDASRLTGRDTNFSRVVAVSYSAFDTFVTPEPLRQGNEADEARTEVFGYVYCGLRKFDSSDQEAQPEQDAGQDEPLRQSQNLKSIDEIEREFAVALREAGQRKERQNLVTAFTLLSEEPSFGRIGVDLRDLSRGLGTARTLDNFGRLSTGHKIVVNIVTQLAAHLRDRSLVLIDEPETHLHPPLMAALLKAIQSLLDAYDSFAIIATHSPVVVQEVPAQYVQVLERIGDRTSIRPPTVETFGEGVGVITRQVFSLDSSATDYQGVLADLAERHTLEEIEELFAHGLSTQARALVLNYLRRDQ